MFTNLTKTLGSVVLCAVAMGNLGSISSRAVASDEPAGHGWTLHYTVQIPGDDRAHPSALHMRTYDQAVRSSHQLDKQKDYGVKVWDVYISDNDE
jgi:hypothetical protein